jgi:hypothetical protein
MGESIQRKKRKRKDEGKKLEYNALENAPIWLIVFCKKL